MYVKLKENIKTLYYICDELEKRGYYDGDLKSVMKSELVFLLLCLQTKMKYNKEQFHIFKDYLIDELKNESDLDMIIKKSRMGNIALNGFKDVLNTVKVFKSADMNLEAFGLKTSLYECYYITVITLASLYSTIE